jgi:hypothetical protein
VVRARLGSIEGWLIHVYTVFGLYRGVFGLLTAAPDVVDWAQYARAPRCAVAADGCVRVVTGTALVTSPEERDVAVLVEHSDGDRHAEALKRPGPLAARLNGRTVRVELSEGRMTRIEAPDGGWLPTRMDPAARALPALASALSWLAVAVALGLRWWRGRWYVVPVAATAGVVAAAAAMDRARWFEPGPPLAAFAVAAAAAAAGVLLVTRRARAASPRTSSAAGPAAP